ncbi:MAG TPA: hypothetical protein VHO26_06260 [Propionibacteriaceae bacterium]|nr:hypothetical protein [Propionibacteriaceae bacterium]
MMTNTPTTPAAALELARTTVTGWEAALDDANTQLGAANATPATPAQAAQVAAQRVQARELVAVCTEALRNARANLIAAEQAAGPTDAEREDQRRREMRAKVDAQIAEQRRRNEEAELRGRLVRGAEPEVQVVYTNPAGTAS